MKTTGRKVEKPWGHEIIWAETEKYLGKILHIRSGHELSLQYHNVKEETDMVKSGVLRLEIHTKDDRWGTRIENHDLGVGECFHIKPGTIHRMKALPIHGSDVEVLEVSTGELLDVVRLSDSYGREGT